MADSEWDTDVKLSDVKVGDKIKIKASATNKSPYGNPNLVKFCSWVYQQEYDVQQVGLGSNPNADYIVFGIGVKMVAGNTTGAINAADIKAIKHKTPITKPEEPKVEDPKPQPALDFDNVITSLKDTEDDVTKAGVETGDTVYRRALTDTEKSNLGDYHAASSSPINKDVYPKIQYAVSKDVFAPQGSLANGEFVNAPLNRYTEEVKDSNGNVRRVTKTAFITASSLSDETNSSRSHAERNRSAAKRTFDYYIDIPVDDTLEELELRHGISHNGNRLSSYKNKCENYFRYKLANPNDKFAKGFAHIFFTRPDLNILVKDSADTDLGFKLAPGVENDPDILYAWNKNPYMLLQLIGENGSGHNFMFALSNAASGFSLVDETLKNSTWGESWTGNKIAYGKHNIENKTVGEFHIDYSDDRNLNIYHLHKIWMDYISKVYRGELLAKGMDYYSDDKGNGVWQTTRSFDGTSYSILEDRILDYACSVYYILTAEDGESIIFWSKYYGVFPVVAPSSGFSTSNGLVSRPKHDITYRYSYKKDFDPYNLAEFNNLTAMDTGGKFHYMPIYDPVLLGAGFNKVGPPFIETIHNANKLGSEPYQFKLRFRPATSANSSGDYTTADGDGGINSRSLRNYETKKGMEF